MKNKMSKGLTIAVSLLSLYTLIVLVVGFVLFIVGNIPLKAIGLLISIVYLASVIGLWLLKNWARISFIIISLVSSGLFALASLTVSVPQEGVRDPIYEYVFNLILCLSSAIFFAVIAFYFTRSKIKEQFK